jgi:16S rRNA (cytosine967-C5)-methyltransferase
MRLVDTSLAFAFHASASAIAEVIAGRNLNEALARCWRERPQLAPAARGAIQDLAYGTLRQFGRGDFLLSRLMEKPLRDAQVRALLLAALGRLAARPEEAHTIVDQAVEAAGATARGKYKALANGVLRNFLRRREALAAEAAADEVARWCHPRWWIARLKRAYPNDWQAVLAAGNTHPPMALRVNPRRATPEAYPAQLEAAGIAARALDGGALLLERPVGADKLPGFAAGLCSVQDAGAQRAAPLLDVHDGMRVLDACAAPGGKTAHILELAEVDLLALDADAGRAVRVSENLLRLGLRAAPSPGRPETAHSNNRGRSEQPSPPSAGRGAGGWRVKPADCRDLDAWWDGRPFDRILADVPCSASGVARRHPDIKWLRRESDIAEFARTQAEILDALWRVLAPGGKLLYATCSVFPEENARQVAAFAARQEDCMRLPIAGMPELQLLPTDAHDGFFYALLEKQA